MDRGAQPIGEAAGGEPRRSPFGRWLAPKLPFLIVASLLTALAVLVLWPRVFITVKSGEAGVLYRLFTGTQVDRVYGGGLHIITPWNTMHLYETRKQVALHDFDVLSVKGLRVHLALAIRYRPDYEQLGLLHQRIGPDYVQRVVVPQTESVLRKQLGRHTAAEIYTNERGLLSNAIALAIEEVGRNYVQVQDIVIRSIALPERVKQAIEDKVTQEELLKSYVFRLETAEREAERKRVEARGIRDYQERVDATLSERLLRHAGIQATRELATSENARVVVVGAGEDGLPLVLRRQ